MEELTPDDKRLLLSLFIEDMEGLSRRLKEGEGHPRVLVLTEPLCDPVTRERIFRDIIRDYGSVDGHPAMVMLKQHPRDTLDYGSIFPELTILSGRFPMELLNFVEGLVFDRVVSVYTVVDSLHFVKESIYLGDDFMDIYEAPGKHRFNEEIEEAQA